MPPPLTQLLQHTQRVLLDECAAGRRRADVLTLGYRRDAVEGRIVHTHPNTALTSVATGAAWHALLARLGVRRFRQMLLTTACFCPLAGGVDCFAQLWGEPVTERAPRKRAAPGDAPPHSRAPRKRARPTPGARFFRRARLFSARPVHQFRYGIVLGLPPTHVLHTHGAMHTRTACLARSMFPDAFAPRGARLGRWPRGLRAVRPLLATMLRRHDRFHYAAALAACCPTALPRGGAAPPAARGAPPAGAARIRALQQLARARSRGEPRCFPVATTHGRVCWYVRLVLRRVVPRALLGSAANERVVAAAAARLVCARRRERVALHDALHGFRASHCAWHARGARRTAHAHALVYWLLEELVLPLLRTTFYATETAAFRQRVLYFRQDAWARVSAPLVARLRARVFERVPDAAGAPGAQVRLLPKDTSIRAIVNLRRRTLGVSVNAQLQTAFDVLAYEVARRDGACGAAVHGAHGLFARLRAYRAALVARFGRVPRLYAVRADVRAAFDSLDHAQLVRIVRELLAEPRAYVVQRYTQLKPGLGRVARHAVRRAVDDAAYPRFLETRPAARHAVLVDHVAYALTDAAQVRRQVEAHITHTLVRLGRELHRQRVGVPQGSVLATLLCNVLLADAERTHLAVGGAACLLRYTDDFLFLTPERADAERMCRALLAGFPAHGCFVAPEKTLVNFDCAVAGALVPRLDATERVPWCGYAICPASLAVHADTHRYPYHFGDTLTVHGARPGAALAHRLLHAVRARTHVLYTDALLNTPRGAYANVLEGAVVAAAKLHAYARALRPRHAHAALVVRAIEQAVRMTPPMIASRARLAADTPLAGPPPRALDRAAVEWLAYLGFYAVLRGRPAYAAVVAALEAALQRRTYAAARTRLGRWALREALSRADEVRTRC